MLSKTDEFNFNILLVTVFVLHNKLKYPGSKSSFKIKLRKFAESARVSPEEIEYALIFLLRQGIVYTEDEFLYVNLNLVKSLLKKEFKLKSDAKTLIVQPNYEIIVKPEILLKELFYLIQFATFMKKDVIYRFKLTANSLHNSFILNWSAKKIINFLSKVSEKNIPENVYFFIDEIYKRTGEISLGRASYFATGNKFAIQKLKEDNDLKKMIIDEISSRLILLDNRNSISELFYILKEKGFYPDFVKEKVHQSKDRYVLNLSAEEMENFYSAILTLKEIGFEHKLSINYNSLNNLIEEIEKEIGNKVLIKSKAIDKSVKYQQELKKAIKKYILKTIETNINVPKVVISDRLAEQYTHENPAVTTKEMKKMIDYAIKNRISLIMKVYTPSSKQRYSDYVIEPRYLYKNSLYAYVKELREEHSFDLKKINFIMLPGI